MVLAGLPLRAGEAAPEGWAARAVVESYYAAIDAKDYDRAYGLWDDAGAASGQNAGAFAAGFAETASVEVFTGPARTEGAAGTLHATVPVRVEAELEDGTEQRFAGSYELKRVNDVPGSSAEDRRWHMVSAELREQ